MYRRYGSTVPLTLLTVPEHLARVQFSLGTNVNTPFPSKYSHLNLGIVPEVQGQDLNGT